MSKCDEAFKFAQEVINQPYLEDLIKDRPLKGYWGTAPTGRPHVAYLFPILTISRMIKAGCQMTVMFADYHALLDNNKTEWEVLHSRTEYYMIVIKKLLELTGADTSSVRFVKGTDFQRGNPIYLDDLMRLTSKVTAKIAQKASAEVVKSNKDPLLSNLLYPVMQILDEVHLGTDFELGGVDQRKIFMAAIDYLPRIGVTTKRAYVMTPMINSLEKEGKMSASDVNSKIDLLDSEEDIKEKCSKAWSLDGKVEGNGVLQIYKYIIFDFYPEVKVTRPEKYGGDVTFNCYEDLEKSFIEYTIASVDLKGTLGTLLAQILKPVRDSVLAEYPDLLARAYPTTS